ncbi:MAG TPA: type II CAAX endopeptidase family protein, partial [Terriglobia bacterium]|nr:type II CAAX endopeptidase family protein [Terriglobia bacterium]
LMNKNRNHTRFAQFTIAAVTAAAVIGAAFNVSAATRSTFEEDSSKTFAERVRAAGADEYGRILGEFDEHLALQPNDDTAAVERCRFIDQFAYSEEETIAAASEDSERCKDGLRSGVNAQSNAARLYLWLDSVFEKDAVAIGEKFLREGSWTPRQRAAIHEALSDRYQTTDVTRSGEHAVEAVDFDPTSRLRLRAAEHYIRIGQKSRAVRTLEMTRDEDWNSWTLESAVTMLLNIGEGRAARGLVEARKDIDLDPASRIQMANALISAGEEEAGRALAGTITGADSLPEHYGTQLEREIFAFQLSHGSAADAIKAYRALRDKGYDADAFGRSRLALSVTHWSAPWQWADLAGVFATLAVFACIGLLPLLVLLPIHHRSVVKQLRGFVPAPLAPESPWSLRNAWYAFTIFLFAGTLTPFVFSYPVFESRFGQFFGVFRFSQSLPDDRELGRAIFWASIVSLPLLLPLLRRTNLRTVLFGSWSIRRSIGAGLGMSLVLLFVTGLFKLLFSMGSNAGLTLGTETVRSLQGLYSIYGALGLLACSALMVPVLEEFTFRGVFLRSVARHIPFWVAALLQAAIFVSLHEDTSAFPFLFTFALVASALARRSGGLLAPITMHAVNNAIASLAILKLTGVLT